MKSKRVLMFLMILIMFVLGVRAYLQWFGVRAEEITGMPVQTTEKAKPEKTEKVKSKDPVTEKPKTETTEEATESSTTDTPSKNKKPATLRISAVGDIMFHGPQVTYAETADGYDFWDSFELIAPYIERADFSVGNYETTSTPDSYEYAGYPMFNTPPAAIDAIKQAGFDALSTANNHCIDTRLEGIGSTIDQIRARDLAQFGTHKEANEPIETVEVNGISIALLSYTYGFNGMEQVLSDEEYEIMVEPLDPEAIEADITKAKEDGAELVIVYPHWGIEYQRWPSDEQMNLAKNMVDWGADLVLGSHPHVVQPQEWITAKDGRVAYVIYSMGNFISGQRLEYNEDIHVEQSLVLDIMVERDKEGKVAVKSVDAIPIWVDRTDNGLFRTVAAEDGLGQYAHMFEDWKIARIQSAYDDTMDVLSWDVGEDRE